MSRRPSPQTRAVLERLVSESSVWHYGYDLANELEIASGTLYPILMRLHDRDVLETRWENSPIEGKPRRHLYRLTPGGADWARSVIASPRARSTRPSLGTT